MALTSCGAGELALRLWEYSMELHVCPRPTPILVLLLVRAPTARVQLRATARAETPWVRMPPGEGGAGSSSSFSGECALVSSSGALLANSHGAAIDTHRLVARLSLIHI